MYRKVAFLEGFFILFPPFKAKNNEIVCPSPVERLIAWKPHEFSPGQPAILDGCFFLLVSFIAALVKPPVEMGQRDY